MEDKLQILYNSLVKEGYELPSYDMFKTDMSDTTKSKKLHDNLVSEGYELPDYDTFLGDMGLKKKEDSLPELLGNIAKKSALDSELGVKPSSTEQPQLISDKKDTGSYLGDVLERMGAGALDWITSGGKQSKFANKLLNIPKKIVEKELSLFGVGEETAKKISGSMPFLKPPIIGDAIALTGDVWDKIEKTDEFKAVEDKEQELRESSARYDQSIEQLIANKDYKKAIGASFLAASESLPLTLTAMFGGPVGLAGIGAYSAATQYDQLGPNTDMNEAQKTANALINGTLEIATERLGSANYGKLIKSLYKTAGKEVAEKAVKGGLNNWFRTTLKRFGLLTAPAGEGLEELVNQLGNNITARATGEDPDRPINFNLIESTLPGIAGGTSFVLMGAPAQIKQSFKPTKEDNAPPKPKEGEKKVEKKVTDMDYSFNGKEITKEDAEQMIDEAKDINKLNGLKFKEDKALESRIRDKFNIPIEEEEKEVPTKIEEETEDAKRIRGETEKTSEQAQGVVEGEEGGLRVRDASQDRMEAGEGEEIKPVQETPPFTEREQNEYLNNSKTVFETEQDLDADLEVEKSGIRDRGFKEFEVGKMPNEPVILYRGIKKPELDVLLGEYDQEKLSREYKEPISRGIAYNKQIAGGEFNSPVERKFGASYAGDKQNAIKAAQAIRRGYKPTGEDFVYGGETSDKFVLTVDARDATFGVLRKEKFKGENKIDISEFTIQRGINTKLPITRIVKIEKINDDGTLTDVSDQYGRFINDNLNSLKPQISPVEPLSTPSEGNVPPIVENPPEIPKISPETKYRRAQINSLIQDQTLQQQEVSKIVDANKERYQVLHQGDAINQAKALIDNLGVQGASLELKKESRSGEQPIRQVARQVLLDFYSRAIIDPNATEADKKVAFENIDDLQQITAREATSAGQSNAMLQIWKDQQPAGLLEFVRRKIEQSNEKVLNKKIGETTLGEQLNELFDTLSKESQNIIKDILAGKTITTTTQETKVKPPATRKYVPKERIKAEQDYRKNLLADFKRKQGTTLSASATGLTSDQIELGGNLLASYVREGYYRVQEVIDRLKQDFKSVGVELDDKQTEELLSGGKNDKETFGEYLERKESQARMREGEKMINKRIADVITEHWTEKDELKRTLAQKLIDEAGLTPEEAKRLEEKILKEFDQKILERSQKQLTKILGTEKIPTEKKKQGVVGKMIDLLNMGALDEQLYRDLFAEKFKLVKLTDEHKAEILRLASNVQMASGKGWLERDATIRLAKYIYELYPQERAKDIIDTWISLSYANMLMGPSTSILNLLSAGSNMALKPFRNISNLNKWLRLLKGTVKEEGDIYNPFGEMMYVPALRGIGMGAKEAAEVYKNGDLNNKYVEDVAKKGQFKVTPLERNKYGQAKRFKPVNVKIAGKSIDLNIFNLAKYAGRNLAAQDKLMLTTSYEIEVAQILRDKLKNKDLRGRELTREVMSYMRGERIDRNELNKTLDEDAKLYKQMTGQDMTPLQRRIRERELELEQLPLTQEEREEAERLARSNIFTDDRSGLIATVANAIGRVANSSQMAGMIIKPFVPFTKVVGNVAEYMIDHTPYYGFMRANGWGVTGIAKRISGKDFMTSRMGEKGSRLYEEQMGRAWFGTMAFSLGLMMLIGKDDEDSVEISGGYKQEGFKKKGRENVMPPYTLRIGNFKIPYKNIPGLAIPLSLIGNINDALKAGQGEGEIVDRLNAALLFDATYNSVFMIKDMSFLDGVQRFTEIASDIASTDRNKLEQVGEGVVRSYVGFMSRALPENNNAIQQIWKIFDPTAYSQNDIKGMLGYASGLQHFLNRPVLDQLGDEVKTYPGETLMPYTHWLNLKGNDPRWQFLAKNNAIPNKIYNHVVQIETKKGIDKRNFEPDELFDYTKRAGKLFSESLVEYMKDKEKTAQREKEFIERDKGNGETERISGVREDVEKLWADAKDQAMVELFRWGSVKENMPRTWDLIKKYEAFFPYHAEKQIEGYKLTDSELYQYNNRVTVRYAELIKEQLESLDKQPSQKPKNISNLIDEKKKKAEEDIEKAMRNELKSKIEKIK